VDFWDDEIDKKRTLGMRDKQILYDRAKGRCENPACRKKISFIEMQPGHKNKAWSKGGKTTLANSVCLCYACNKKQGTDSWDVFLKKQGIENPKIEMKKALGNLTLQQLKSLASKHKVKVTGYIEEDFFSTRRVAPTKRQYINKLAGVMTTSDLRAITKETSKPGKKKTKK
jgi:hypothetical protein